MRSVMGFTINTAATPTPSAVVRNQQQHSPWHSPVPYLFGGLAAMLGLIALALLILACSYWKLSGYLESGNVDNEDAKPGDADVVKAPPVFEEKVVVIMAGDEKPTFLATPMSSRASSLCDKNKTGGLRSVEEGKEEEGKDGEGDGGTRTNQDHGHREA